MDRVVTIYEVSYLDIFIKGIKIFSRAGFSGILHIAMHSELWIIISMHIELMQTYCHGYTKQLSPIKYATKLQYKLLHLYIYIYCYPG